MKNYIKILFVMIIIASLDSCVPSVRFADNSKENVAKTNSKSITIKNTTNTNTNSDQRFNDSKEADNTSSTKFRGAASYYGDEFEGRKTSSGQIFTQDGFTAAHKELPFGTKLRVMNLRNGRTVTVVINDRGPFVAGRVLDLSKSAAEQIDMVRDGVVEVECSIVF